MRTRLKTARTALNLRQKDVAERLAMRQSSYSNWEAGLSAIPNAKIPLICKLLGINETWLRTGEGEMLELPEATPSPYHIAIDLGCGESAAQLFAHYCELPKKQKEAFEELVNRLFAAKQAANAQQTIKINSINGNNNNATIN